MSVKTRAERKAYRLTAGLSLKGIRKLAAQQRERVQQEVDLAIALDAIVAVLDFDPEKEKQRKWWEE